MFNCNISLIISNHDSISLKTGINIKIPTLYYPWYKQLSTREYYDNKVVSIDHATTGFSTAVFKDKLEDYIYSQSLDEVFDIEETVEIIEGHVPITYNKKVESIIKYYRNQGRRYVRLGTVILPDSGQRKQTDE